MAYYFKKMIQKNYLLFITIIVGLVFILINIFDLHYKMIDLNITGRKYYFVYFIICMILSIIIVLLLKYSKKYYDNIPKLFVVMSIVIGLLFLGVSPLFTGSDEQNHYYRIYEITEGNFLTPTGKYVGSKMPKSLQKTYEIASGKNTTIKYKDIKKMYKIPLKKKNKVIYGNSPLSFYDNTALYSPITYFPQAIGFIIGKIFNFNPFFIGMLGRVFNLLFYTLLGYLSLRIIPKGKMYYLLILLSPNMIQCASTLSADAFTNGIFLLIIALLFNIIFRTEKITKKEELLLFILSFVIALCKIVYLPIILSLFLLPKDKYQGGKKEKYLFIVITFIISCCVSLLWMKSTGGIFAITYDQTQYQKEFILHHIIEYAIIFIRTMFNNFTIYVECLFVGTTMYHSQLAIPSIISIAYVILVLLSSKFENKKWNYSLFQIILLSFISIVIIGLIGTAIYVQCTAQYFAVGNRLIMGIQGRYFIPVIFLLPFIIQPRRFNPLVKKDYFIYLMLFIHLITLFYAVNQFLI